jgi:hypothetical protein
MPLGSRGISLHDLEERGQASPCRSPARRPDPGGTLGSSPPSKTLTLALLKEPRAGGVGCVLSKQNPVELNAKAYRIGDPGSAAGRARRSSRRVVIQEAPISRPLRLRSSLG